MVKPTQRVAPAAVRAAVAASSAATLVLMRVFGLARRVATASIAASPASMRAARAAPSRAALLLECTQITGVAIDRGRGCLEGAPHPVGVAEPGPGQMSGFLPGGCVGLCPVPEPGVLTPAVGYDGHETPTMAGDVAHGLFRAELAVRDVQEARGAYEGV